MSTLRLRNLATLPIEQQLTDNINFGIAIEEFGNKGKESYCVKIVVFIKKIKMFLFFYTFLSIIHYMLLFLPFV